MQKPVTRLISTWATHPTYGLAAYAVALGKPVDFSLDIFNSADDVEIMQDGMPNPPSSVAYCIWSDSTAVGMTQGQRDVFVCGGLVTDETVTEYEASELAEVVNRAALLSFEKFKSAGTAKEYRERDRYRITGVARIVQELLVSAKGTRRMWGFTGLHVLAVDSLSTST